MTDWRRSALPVLLTGAILGAAAWWWSGRQSAGETAGPPRNTPERQAAYYVKEFVLRTTDASGDWRYRVRAPSMYRFESSGTWEFETPRWTLYPRQGQPWYGRAESATARDRGRRVELHGAVSLWRDAEPDAPPVNVETSEVLLLTEAREAHTEHYARVSSPGREIEGVGAVVRLEPEQIEFLSEVKGRYLPEEAQ